MPPARTVVVLSAAVAAVYGAWTLWSGIRLGVDTATYSAWADQLIAADFNVAAYLDGQRFVAPPILYVLWIVVVASLKVMLGPAWMAGVVVLNWVALSAGTYAVLGAIRTVTRSIGALWLGAVLIAIAGDLLLFTPYVLSDLMFWGVSAGTLACGARLAAHDAADRRRAAALVTAGSVMVAAAFLFRPVAIPLALFWILAVATWMAAPLVNRWARWLLAAVAMAAAGAVIVHAYVLANPSAWPFGSLPPMLVLVGEEYRRGELVHNAALPMTAAPAADTAGFIRITLQKLIFFITPWLPHYSWPHALVNLAFYLPAYGLAAAAVANLRRLAHPQQRAVFVLAGYALALPAFHAMLLVDSDHRYRLPLLPALVMLAALGLVAVRRPRTPASTDRTR